MTLHPKIQKKLLAEFRGGICKACLEYSNIELKCTMTDSLSKEYFSDESYSCPIGQF